MSVVQTSLKLTNYTFTALAVMSSLVTLWMWVQAIQWWGDTYAFATALTWTFVTLVLFSFVAGIEKLQTRGE